jgi:peroxiredoxin
MLPLGHPAPPFSLPDTDGNIVSLEDLGRDVVLVMFICNHCPYVIHIADELARIGRDYQGKVDTVAISSNDVENYPQDSLEKMAEEKAMRGYVFPYLYDETQGVAKAYKAMCTPEFYVFDADRALRYRGRLDDTRPRAGEPTGSELRAALDALLDGRTPSPEQAPSIGCNIKWKPGSAPSYFG